MRSLELSEFKRINRETTEKVASDLAVEVSIKPVDIALEFNNWRTALRAFRKPNALSGVCTLDMAACTEKTDNYVGKTAIFNSITNSSINFANKKQSL